MTLSIPLFWEGKTTMFIWQCFCQGVIFSVKKTVCFLSECISIFPYSQGKYWYFLFFLNLLNLSTFSLSLSEVTATQWGVRRVALQGIPEGVTLLMESWMRNRSLRPAHLFVLDPSRIKAALDTAQVQYMKSLATSFRLYLKACCKPQPQQSHF